MKDKQVEPPSGQPRIPFLSAAVHCVAMTAIVYLRSSFGFAYLRPKSVFFAFTWAFVLFTIFAWMEPTIWRQYRAVCIFGAGAAALYWVHLLTAFLRELYHRGEHDHHSGTSHALRMLQRHGRPQPRFFEMNLHLWAEPAAVLFLGFFLRLAFAERRLSTWLVLAAGCLWFKEAFNYWFELRQRKRQKDTFTDVDDGTPPPNTRNDDTDKPKSTRTGKKKYPRNVSGAEDSAQERRYAELLRLLPPYSLEQAEENYRALIKLNHPDANSDSPESTTRAAELNEAIQYFRKRLMTTTGNIAEKKERHTPTIDT